MSTTTCTELNSSSTPWHRLRSRFALRKGTVATVETNAPSCRENRFHPDSGIGNMPSKDEGFPASSRTDLRWSEVVPPATALTFAAVWDPEEGMMTFGGAELKGTTQYSDATSQVISVAGFDNSGIPTTAQGSFLLPYAHSRFAASELSSSHFPVSPTRRSSAGTGLPLDASARLDPQRRVSHAPNDCTVQTDLDCSLSPHSRGPCTPSTDRTLHPPHGGASHKRSGSGDTGTTGTLTALGYGLCKAFQRERPSTHTREERYGFLRRVAAKEDISDFDKYLTVMSDRPIEPQDGEAPKSAGLRTLFTRSIWARGGLGLGCDGRAICGTEEFESIALDSGFDNFDADSGVCGPWTEGHGVELEKELNRDTNRLKSTFSWTTTSTSRYIDVAEYFDSDSDSTVSASDPPNPSSISGPGSRSGNATSACAVEAFGESESDWCSVEPPTPRPDLVFPEQTRSHRKLVKKQSNSKISDHRSPIKSERRPRTAPSDCREYHVCPHCHGRIGSEIDMNEEDDMIRVDRKGKRRSLSHPQINGLDTPVRGPAMPGRPAAIRSSSSPAVLPPDAFQPIASSPAEVLAREAYNHEWNTAEPSGPDNTSHSESSRTTVLPASIDSHTSGSRSATTGRAATIGHGHGAFSRWRALSPCPGHQGHIRKDVQTVLTGVASGIRPSTPVPGMPSDVSPSPSKTRPPPSSYRHVGGAMYKFGSLGPRAPSPVPTTPDRAQFISSPFPLTPLSRSQSGPSLVFLDSNPRNVRMRTRSLETPRPSCSSRHAVPLHLPGSATYPSPPQAGLSKFRTISHAFSNSNLRRSMQRSASKSEWADDNIWICVDLKRSAQGGEGTG